MPWLQPLALSSATRSAVGGDKGLAPIRSTLVEVCGLPPEERVKLQRLDGETAFIIVTLALSAYFLIPQLADVDDMWNQIRGASCPVDVRRHRVLADHVRRGDRQPARIDPVAVAVRARAMVAQLASSFANRATLRRSAASQPTFAISRNAACRLRSASPPSV